MSTDYDNLSAGLAKAVPLSYFPTPQQFYGRLTGQDAEIAAWVGGELLYYTTTNKLFVQTATSGQTATWKNISTAFATSTSTSTSTSSSSSSTTSSTSSSTSTSTSTSSSTSTSTSTSSTTTP